jgi:anti-sigma-K factor RskA
MMSKMSRDELLELIPAYVLGALDEDERAEVEALLAIDTTAQEIEAEYRQIVDALPFTAESRQASPDLKNRLIQRINENDSAPNIKTLPKSQPQRVSSRVLSLVAVITLIVIGVLFALSNSIFTKTPKDKFIELSNQPDSQEVVVKPSDENPSAGRLIIAADGQEAILQVQQLPDINTDQTFQLWLIDTEGAKDGGLYQSTDSDELYIVIPNERPVNTYTAFGMSVEPAGGSPLRDAPSGDRVFAVVIPEDI